MQRRAGDAALDSFRTSCCASVAGVARSSTLGVIVPLLV
jgi:hypothetical protein